MTTHTASWSRDGLAVGSRCRSRGADSSRRVGAAASGRAVRFAGATRRKNRAETAKTTRSRSASRCGTTLVHTLVYIGCLSVLFATIAHCFRISYALRDEVTKAAGESISFEQLVADLRRDAHQASAVMIDEPTLTLTLDSVDRAYVIQYLPRERGLRRQEVVGSSVRTRKDYRTAPLRRLRMLTDDDGTAVGVDMTLGTRRVPLALDFGRDLRRGYRP